ncbi:hypothetical protein SNE40_012445 [Patella caerulea]|uniref:Uncharacterized protein n=1 Tax=Patella caerulea TaxID=87958 RepID=A0AAN8JRM0_PATCE
MRRKLQKQSSIKKGKTITLPKIVTPDEEKNVTSEEKINVPNRDKMAREKSVETSSDTKITSVLTNIQWSDDRTSKDIINQLFDAWLPQLSSSYRPHARYVPTPAKVQPTPNSKQSSRQSSISKFQLAVYAGRFKTAERVVETCNHFQRGRGNNINNK